MRSAKLGSLVVAMPPSAVVMIFTGWKLKTVMSLCWHEPTLIPWYEAPIACEASSMILKPFSRPKAGMDGMSHG